QLAEEINVPFENLLRTIENYNHAVENQIDHEWNKFFLIRKIETPPFYAIKSNGFTIVSPEGLKVNDQLNVINKDGKSIKNLYAAGEILGFGNTSGNGFVGGMSLTPAMTFGKILGENILQW
ncbi:MAG: FAD-binding protein, partial [Candidatus Micropelagos thuwalensis]|nr:FAD-binding protein [Candidatus Micropelagos thuwalensis]